MSYQSMKSALLLGMRYHVIVIFYRVHRPTLTGSLEKIDQCEKYEQCLREPHNAFAGNLLCCYPVSSAEGW